MKIYYDNYSTRVKIEGGWREKLSLVWWIFRGVLKGETTPLEEWIYESGKEKKWIIVMEDGKIKKYFK